jgi:hypothetical protein
MKLKDLVASRLVLCSLTLLPILAITGCGSGPSQDPAAAAQTQEIEKLKAENAALPQVRTEHEEVQRLRQENQELPKLRNQYQEASRLRKENEQLRLQVAKLAPASTNQQAAASAAAAGANPQLALQDKPKELTVEEVNTLHEGDEILIEPKYLKQLLPDFDWEKLGRKEPLAIRSLLERDGVQITNAAQLREFGVTNFTIQRAVVSASTNAEPAQP